MLKFISLGSGSSGNCYMLTTATDGLLIDSGLGIRTLKKHLKDYGVTLSSVHNILITHDHADHIKSVGYLSQEYNLPVYTTQKVHEGIKRNYCVPRKVLSQNIRYIEKGESYHIGEFLVTPFEVPHDSADNVGYRIEYGDTVFCIITDAGSITDDIKQNISMANYLVIEANHDEEMVEGGPYPSYLKHRILSSFGHLSNKMCGKVIAENMTERLRAVWLCHLSEENNHPELARKTIESVLRSYGIIVGKDIQLDILKRKMPTGFFEL